MIAIKHATRPKAIAQVVLGVIALGVSAAYHKEIFAQAGSVGYFVGGGLILTGVWGWFTVLNHEKRVAAAEQAARLTCADHVAGGIPNTARPPFVWQRLLAVGLIIFGIFTFPLGLIFMVVGAVLWWGSRKGQESGPARDQARFFPRQPYPMIGGEVHGEIRLKGNGLRPTGPTRLSLACRRQILGARAKGSDRISTETKGETVQRMIEAADWKQREDGLAAVVALPVRGGLPSSGPVPPLEYDKPSVGWYLTAEIEFNGREQTLEFVVPVSPGAVEIPPEIPAEVEAAARDILAPGNPGKVMDFLVNKSVETVEVASVSPAAMTAALAAAGIKEVPKHGAVGGHGLQMDPGASQAAQRFMNGGIGCAMLIYLVLGLGALFLFAIPYVGWLLTLGALGFLVWAIRGTLAAKQQINRSPELLWAEPGQLCYMAEPGTEWRVPLKEIDRIEIQWIGTLGDRQYVKISAAQPPTEGGTKRERILLAHGVHGTETARAVIAWLLGKLGADLPVVEAQQGQESLEKMHDFFKDPTKR